MVVHDKGPPGTRTKTTTVEIATIIIVSFFISHTVDSVNTRINEISAVK